MRGGRLNDTSSYVAEALLCEGQQQIWDGSIQPHNQVGHSPPRNTKCKLPARVRSHLAPPPELQLERAEGANCHHLSRQHAAKTSQALFQAAGIFVCYREGKTERELSEESLKQEIKKAPLTMHVDWKGGKAGLSTQSSFMKMRTGS